MGPNQSISDILGALEIGASLQVVSLVDALIALTVSLAIGLLVYVVYRITFDGVLYSRRFALSLVILSLITSFVIVIITSSLILSLGLVGALSIVRFRTAVKEPKDIIFMFWAIATGIGCGAGFYVISIVSAVFIGGVIIALHYLRRGVDSTRLLTISLEPGARRNIIDVLVATGRYKITSESTSADEAEMFVEIGSGVQWDEIATRLGALDGVRRVASLEYDRNSDT